MYIEWTQHLTDPEEKAKFEKEIYSAKGVLDHLKAVVEKKTATLDRQETNMEVYNMPNWSHRQAHKNGQRSSLDWLKTLVDLDKQKKEKDYDGQFNTPKPTLRTNRPTV